jgi:hypothetical protein
MGTIASVPQDMKALREWLVQQTVILNQGLQALRNRTDTIQQAGAKAPPTVTGLTVTGKQGLFHLTWNRIKNADGYSVVQASDSGMTQLVGRFNVADGDSCTFQVPVGNVAVTNSFQVYAYQGSKYSEPSPAVTGTTLAYGSVESAPPAPPLAPRQPKIAPIRSGPNL